MPPKKNTHDFRSNRKHFKRDETSLSIPDRVESIEDRATIGWIAVDKTLKEVFQDNLKKYLKEIHLDEHYSKFHYVLQSIRTFGDVKPLPRVVNTREESKLHMTVKNCWISFVNSEDFFPPWLPFYEKVCESYLESKPTKQQVRDELKLLDVYVTHASDVANASSAESCAKRKLNAEKALEAIAKYRKDNGTLNGLVFFDETKMNQLDIESTEYLSPSHVQPFKRNHHRIVTQSVSVLLTVTAGACIVDATAYNNKTEGSTTYTRIIDYFNSLSKSKFFQQVNGKPTVYLDNAAAHTRAVNGNLGKASAQESDQQKTQREQYISLQKKMNKKFTFIFAPSCTPDSNLAEFFFRSLKADMRSKIAKARKTMDEREWLTFVQENLLEWQNSFTPEKLGIDKIVHYLQDLIDANGDLQLLAIKQRGFVDYKDFAKKQKMKLVE